MTATKINTYAELSAAVYSEKQLKSLLVKKTLTRTDISNFLKLRKNMLCELISKKRIQLPNSCGKVRQTNVYDSRQVVAWLKTKPFKNVHLSQTPDLSKSGRGLDNKLALAFLTAKPESTKPMKPTTWSDLAKKYRKRNIVHLEERNDYVPPHSQLTLYRGTGDHDYAVLR